jgi:hypothetical protein
MGRTIRLVLKEDYFLGYYYFLLSFSYPNTPHGSLPIEGEMPFRAEGVCFIKAKPSPQS